MRTAILILHSVISIGLVTLILLQTGKGGLGRAFGGGDQFRSKRGAEQLIFRVTIAVMLLFFITSVLSLVVQ